MSRTSSLSSSSSLSVSWQPSESKSASGVEIHPKESGQRSCKSSTPSLSSSSSSSLSRQPSSSLSLFALDFQPSASPIPFGHRSFESCMLSPSASAPPPSRITNVPVVSERGSNCPHVADVVMVIVLSISVKSRRTFQVPSDFTTILPDEPSEMEYSMVHVSMPSCDKVPSNQRRFGSSRTSRTGAVSTGANSSGGNTSIVWVIVATVGAIESASVGSMATLTV